MRIAVAGMHHESNTFTPILTGPEDFVVLRGNDILTNMRPYGSMHGIIATLQAHDGCEVIPTVLARATPGGVVSKAFYLRIKAELLERMRALENIDALTLALHGSMRVEEIGDAEGDLLKALRAIFPNIPIIAALDMHATVTDAMMCNATAFVGYKCAPHTDTYETGAQAAQMTCFTLERDVPLTMATVRVPILTAGEKTETSVPPMTERIARLRELECDPEVLAASYLLGFPWADTETNGVFPLVVTADNAPKARRLVQELAREFWDIRREFKFHTETYAVVEAVQKAISATERPTFLSDSGDNPTAGAAGDSTQLLRVLLNMPERHQLPTPILYAGFYDPQSVAVCLGHEGQDVPIQLGGHFERQAGAPLPLTVTVRTVLRGWGLYGADLVHVRYENLDIILASKHIGFVDPSMMRDLRLEPTERDLVIVKLGYLTDPFKQIAARSIMALSRGASHEVLENLNYCTVQRPVFPLDPECQFRTP